MKPPFPSPVPTWHNDVYPEINPNAPNLSHAGHTVIITGAGSGIGRETAIAFAAAGAKHVVLIGRTESTLNETKSLIKNEAVTSSVYPCDVLDEKGTINIAEKVGTWDVLILNAAYISAPSHVGKGSIDEWWNNYEVNVKSIAIAAKAFLPHASPTRAAVLANTAATAFFPAKMVLGLSGYLCSKLAQIKTMEFLAAENHSIFFANMHPGMIDTKTFRGSGATPDMLPMDTPKLPAHFMVWLSTPEAQFLNGRTVWANWDVTELKGLAQEIESKDQLKVGFEGSPFPYVG